MNARFSSRMRLAALAAAAVLAANPADGRAADSDPSGEPARQTLVLHNTNDPLSGIMANYYAMKRGIPNDHIVGLACPVTEEITREDYERTIEKPLRELFYQRGWWKTEMHEKLGMVATTNKIRFVALIRGIPLKVDPGLLIPEGGPTPKPIPGGIPTPTPTPAPPPKPMERREASVDTEIASLGFLSKPPEGAMTNPYFKSYLPIQSANLPPLMLVARLDGPTIDTVRNIIDDSIAAEQQGIGGVAMIDTRNIQNPGYKMGDDWINRAATDLRKYGMPVLHDNAPEVFHDKYPVRDVGFYIGWYSEHVRGPFANPAFRFRKGTIAVHLHSFSAASIRNPTQYWTAPLLERGAAATLGNVYEPYLGLTPHLDIFTDRLLSGLTLAEAAYMSIPSLSWMTTIVGDPLYRPFAAWTSLTPDDPDKEMRQWNAYRTHALQWRESGEYGVPESIVDPELRAFYLESLADLREADGQRDKALATLRKARAASSDPARRIRTILREAWLLTRAGRKPEAVALLQNAMIDYESHPAHGALAAMERKFNPPPPPSEDGGQPEPAAQPGNAPRKLPAQNPPDTPKTPPLPTDNTSPPQRTPPPPPPPPPGAVRPKRGSSNPAR